MVNITNHRNLQVLSGALAATQIGTPGYLAPEAQIQSVGKFQEFP
jgi:hypothetical protein